MKKKLDIANIADRTQHYSSEFKKMGCEKQECGKYQPFRMFIENTLAVEITMTAVKTKAAIFMSKFGVKQHDKVLRKRMEMDEKGHNGRPPNYEKERREDLEKVGYYFIRINPDKIDFKDYEEFGRISSYIAKSTKKTPKNQC